MYARITAAQPQKRRPNRIDISADGVFLGSVEDIVWVQSGLKIGDELTEEVWQAMQGRQEEQIAMNRALDNLAARARGKEELRKFLLGKGHDADAVERVLAKLAGLGYLDDSIFAGMLVRDRVNLKGAGRRAIAAELRRVGIDEETAQRALEEYDPQEEEAAAQAQALKALRATTRETDPRKRRAKVYASLARRGFSHEIIQSVVNRLLDAEPEEME